MSLRGVFDVAIQKNSSSVDCFARPRNDRNPNPSVLLFFLSKIPTLGRDSRVAAISELIGRHQEKPVIKSLFLLGMHCVLLTELAVLLHFQLLFHLLLVTLGIVADAPTVCALQFGHIVFNRSHSLGIIP